MSKADNELYNAMVDSGHQAMAMRAVQDLKAAYVKANGIPPKLQAADGGGPAAVSAGEKYESWEQVKADMRDPRYLNNDAAFHRKVDEKFKRSSL
jgi:hypothetical protein